MHFVLQIFFAFGHLIIILSGSRTSSRSAPCKHHPDIHRDFLRAKLIDPVPLRPVKLPQHWRSHATRLSLRLCSRTRIAEIFANLSPWLFDGIREGRSDWSALQTKRIENGNDSFVEFSRQERRYLHERFHKGKGDVPSTIETRFSQTVFPWREPTGPWHTEIWEVSSIQ